MISRGDWKQTIPEIMYKQKNIMYRNLGGTLFLRSNKNKIATRISDIIVLKPPTNTLSAKNDAE